MKKEEASAEVRKEETSAEVEINRLDLDLLLKHMFTMSSYVIIQFINGLFKRNYDPDKVEIRYGNNEFPFMVDKKLTSRRGDIIIEIVENGHSNFYHIELQLKNDQSMVIREFLYGFLKGLEGVDLRPGKQRVLEFPHQYVIFLEENSAIKDELFLLVKFPDSQQVNYKVPVMKYWKYSSRDLMERKMYLLLPLQVFKLRKQIKKALRKVSDEEERGRVVRGKLDELKDMIREIAGLMEKLYEDKEIVGIDMEKMELAVNNISNYLYEKYKEYDSEEVKEMMTYVVSPAVKAQVRKEGKLEGKLEGILEGILEGKRGAILDLLSYRGSIDDHLMDVISKQNDIAVLSSWHKLAFQAKSMEEFERSVL